jgi:hypothetical protein
MIAGVQPTPRLRDVAGCGLATSRTTSREESRATTRGSAACGMLRDVFSSPHGRAPARTRARIREAGAGKHPAASRTSRKRLRDADLGCGMCCGMALSASRTSRIRRGNLAPMTYDRAHWEQLWAKTLREHPDKVAQRPPNAHFIAEVCGLRSGRALDAGCGHGAETLWLAAHGWEVTAVDCSASALAHARSTAEGSWSRASRSSSRPSAATLRTRGGGPCRRSRTRRRPRRP